MKQEKKKEARSKEQGAWKMKHDASPMSKPQNGQLNVLLKSNRIANQNSLCDSIKSGSAKGLNNLIIQNLGKGPPGRTRSPVRTNCLKPDNQPTAFKSSKSQYNKEVQLINIKVQSITNIKFLQS